MNQIIKIFILSIMVVACQNKTVNKNKVEIKQNWERLKIHKGNETIYVSFCKGTPFCNDTCYYLSMIQDTVYAKMHKGSFPSHTFKFVLLKPEKDSVLKLAFNAITNPVQTDEWVSDYAGQYVTIALEQGGTSISCKYSSVTDWTKTSPTLAKLSQMTFGKVKQDKIN